MFDKLTNREIIDTVWKTIGYNLSKPEKPQRDIILNECVNNLIKRAMLAESQDNLSVVLVFFKKLF